MTYILLKPLLFVLTHLPLKALKGMGLVIAFFAWHLLKERRNVAIVNAKIVGARDPLATARKSFDYTFVSYLETFYAPNIDDKFVKKYVKVWGYENFKSLDDKTKDYVLVGGHFGAWALIANIVKHALGIKIITIGRASRNKGVDKIISELRTFDDIKYITHRGAMEQLPKYMAEGYHPGVYIDHSATPKDCINVPFFGYKAPMIAGIPAFCARKNLPALPFFCVITDTGYELRIYPPIYPDKSLKPKERIEKIATDINKVYETVFSAFPEQWYLIHRRFKRVEEPDGTISDRVYR